MSGPEPKLILTVTLDEEGLTLERLLAGRDAAHDPLEALRLIEAGAVFVDDRRSRDPTRRVRAGERVRVRPAATSARPASPLEVLYVDDDLIVVAKPAGVPVQPTRQGATGALEEAVLDHLGRGTFVAALHRLDLDASGAVLFARRRAACAPLQRQLARRELARRYELVVAGRPTPAAGVHQGSIARAAGDGRRRVVSSHPGARPASTRYRTLELFSVAALLEATLETGRTHQLRVHFADAGHPLVGDRLYGGPPAARLLLHAVELGFRRPRDDAGLVIRCPPPEDFERAVAALRRGAA